MVQFTAWECRTVRRLQKEQIELLQNENAILRELYRAKVQELEKMRFGC